MPDATRCIAPFCPYPDAQPVTTGRGTGWMSLAGLGMDGDAHVPCARKLYARQARATRAARRPAKPTPEPVPEPRPTAVPPCQDMHCSEPDGGWCRPNQSTPARIEAGGLLCCARCAARRENRLKAGIPLDAPLNFRRSPVHKDALAADPDASAAAIRATHMPGPFVPGLDLNALFGRDRAAFGRELVRAWRGKRWGVVLGREYGEAGQA